MSYNRDEAMRWYIEALRLNKADYCRAKFAVDLAFKLRDAVAEIERLEDRLANSRALADKFAGQIFDLEEARSRYEGGHDAG